MTTDQNGVILKCDSGCQACVPSSSTTGATICTSALDGYTIIGGVITKCGRFCMSCMTSSPTICSACYPGSVLIGGGCAQCSDSNALTCSPYNITFSLTCVRGYTPVYFTNTTAGVCSACASYCKRCDTAGPGNCDANSCQTGSVMLSGTTNCTLCFGACLTCS